MKQRIISGIVLAVFCIAIIFFNYSFPFALNMALALISVCCIYEIMKALSLLKSWAFLIPSVLISAVVFFVPNREAQFLSYCVYTLLVFLALLRYHKDVTFKELAVIYSMAVLIPCALKTLIDLRTLSDSHGMFYVIIAVSVAWASDVGAFFAGTFFGKHNLAPEISPKKTIEGAVGGLILNILFLLAMGFVFSQVVYGGEVHSSYLSLFLIGLLGTPISIIGDLSFSLIKRSCHIKDFGQVIPGHGGLLDRFDSVIFTAPFVLILCMFLPIVP